MWRCCVFALAFAPGLAGADVITYRITGLASSVTQQTVPAPPFRVLEGDPVLAYFTLDLSAIDSNPSPDLGIYQDALVSAELHAGTGSWYWSRNPPGFPTTVFLNSESAESVSVWALSQAGDRTQRAIWFWGNYPDLDALTTDTLPFDLTGLANSKLLFADETYPGSNTTFEYFLHFSVTPLTVTTVPAPAAGWLLASALSMAGMWKRGRRQIRRGRRAARPTLGNESAAS